ncbi:MAG TPA: Hsp20/alpha crystallin family protein [Gemmatimonas sp.]|uniref:Hsp20/alpha crystallin family protein n=1 Tax=Gemmatimonas sp. TaxID=1962908 RepID=UPI002ED864FF
MFIGYTASPFSRRAVRRDLHRIFDQAFQGHPFAASQQANASSDDTAGSPEAVTWQPAVEARESAQQFTFALDLPGVNPDAVEVLAADGVLTVKGHRAARETVEGERTLQTERTTGQFVRKFRLPKTADLQKISASYALGVLTIQVLKAEPIQPVRVPVNVAQASV